MADTASKHALTIEFCVPCDFRPQAIATAEEAIDLWADRLSDVRLEPSTGGRFEVTLDDELIFSKAQLDRHAEPGEIKGLIQSRIGAPTAALFG